MRDAWRFIFGRHGWGWIYINKHTTIGTPTRVLQYQLTSLALISQGEDSYGAAHGAGENLVHLRLPNRFHFISRNGSTMFCDKAGMINIRLLPEGRRTRQGPRTDRLFNHRERSLRWVMSYGRSHINEYLPRINLVIASLTVHDESRELQQTRRILSMVDTLGSAWKGRDYDPRQVLSNQAGSKYVLFQYSNGRLQNDKYPNQQLEETSVLGGRIQCAGGKAMDNKGR